MNLLDEIEKKFQEAIKLANNGKEKKAIVIMSRCMRALERYIGRSHGADRIRAIILLRKIGKIHTELSEKEFKTEENN